mgnify:CR=1 FL=1|jgi:threonine/homoserine/homoserine lactone efflux protein
MFNLANYLIYAVVLTFTPGPNTILSMSNGTRFGFKKSLPFIFGVLFGFSAVMLISAVFSKALYSLIPQIKPVMLIVGAAYMLWLAWKIWKSDTQLNQANDQNASFLSGLILQFVNVKVYILGITSMSTYILPFTSDPWKIAGLSSLLVLSAFLANLSWLAFGSVFRKLFRNYGKLINGIMALLLVYTAVSLFMN